MSEAAIPDDLKKLYGDPDYEVCQAVGDSFEPFGALCLDTLIERIAAVEAERDALKKRRFSEENGTTHWEGCWRDHYACAMHRMQGLALSNRTLGKALQRIRSHMEIAAGSAAPLSAVWRIADAALAAYREWK